MSETLAIQTMEALARRDLAFVLQLASADATASGGVLPGTIPLRDAMQVMGALWAALPDFRVEIIKVNTVGDEVAVDFMWGGTHNSALNLPGAASIPATGKAVWVADRFALRFGEGTLEAVRVESPAAGGIPGMLAQIGAVTA